ncbi:MAG: FkbM family methyltransferase [Simkaniaceae bacterium]|nr:FkbM family methyltransferase [Simkaniaceae bacterium]
MRIFSFCFFVLINICVHATPIKFISQKDQDRWIIEEVFNYKKNGFFVDLAAADGISLNNTYNLEKHLNWKGICIEPNPKFFAKLKKIRSVILDSSVVDGVNHSVEFRYDNMMLGGIVDDDTDNCVAIRKKQIVQARKNRRIMKCNTLTLEQILDKYNAPHVIDYLSLDVEGSETRILRNFPFDKYIFLAMTIERPTPELNALLFANGYIFVKNFAYDSFYVHESIENLRTIKKENFEQIPKKDW